MSTPTPQPLTPAEFKALLAQHSGMPQCATCMQPQRCKVGRLLDTIGMALERQPSGRWVRL